MLFLILLIPPLATYLPFYYGRREGKSDAAKITANGSLDTLKERFHANNLLKRGAVALAIMSVVTFVMHITAGFSWWFALFYGLYFTAAFGFMFTTTLNMERGLPVWYVSADKRASETDKMFRKIAIIWNWNLRNFSRKLGIKNGWKLMTTPSEFSRILHTGFLLAGILLLFAFVWVNS